MTLRFDTIPSSEIGFDLLRVYGLDLSSWARLAEAFEVLADGRQSSVLAEALPPGEETPSATLTFRVSKNGPKILTSQVNIECC